MPPPGSNREVKKAGEDGDVLRSAWFVPAHELDGYAEAERVYERDARGRRIPHASYPDELQRVKLYIADRDVYGVDLNPAAGEPAEVSLWLNCIHRGGRVPWFGCQLVCGNSLMGARRQVFRTTALGRKNRKPDLWFNHAPERAAPENGAFLRNAGVPPTPIIPCHPRESGEKAEIHRVPHPPSLSGWLRPHENGRLKRLKEALIGVRLPDRRFVLVELGPAELG